MTPARAQQLTKIKGYGQAALGAGVLAKGYITKSRFDRELDEEEQMEGLSKVAAQIKNGGPWWPGPGHAGQVPTMDDPITRALGHKGLSMEAAHIGSGSPARGAPVADSALNRGLSSTAGVKAPGASGGLGARHVAGGAAGLAALAGLAYMATRPRKQDKDSERRKGR